MANLDASDFLAKSKEFQQKMNNKSVSALGDVANELLRLSQQEVPHDTGQLQNTGSTQQDGEDFLVGYNKVYAMRLHEHPEFRFQKGRKGKYLEDPLKRNTHIFQEHFINALNSLL